MPVQTLPFQSLIVIDRSGNRAVFQQLADGLIELIRSGTLRCGARIPSSRELAGLLKLNRTTVVAAYDELIVQGWLCTEPRKGIRVAAVLPVLTPQAIGPPAADSESGVAGPASFFRHVTAEQVRSAPQRPIYELVVNDGYPDARIAPMAELLGRYRYLQGRPMKFNAIVTEHPTGAESLRLALAAFLSATRGMNATPEQIMITRGAQSAIFIAAQLILRPGSRVLVGTLSYRMAGKVFEQLGATLVRIDVDEDGMNVDMIEAECRKARPDLLYIIPHHHHPTTVTLSAARRRKLLCIVEQYRLPVIEDDYDYDFHYQNAPILPLASADRSGLILYIGSISKMLSLTVRAGFLVGGQDFIWQVGRFRELMELRGDYLMEDSIAHLFTSGEMQRHISRSVKLYKERRDLFCAMMTEELRDVVRFRIPEGGMAVWGRFEPEFPLAEISAKLAKQNIYLNDGSFYNQGNTALNSVRLGFASLNESEMERVVREIRRSID